VRVAGHVESPSEFGRARNPDARRGLDLDSLAPGRERECRGAAQVAAMVHTGDAQRLGKFAGAGAKLPRIPQAAVSLHSRDPVNRLERPDEDESPTRAFHQHVEHPVDAVVEVHVGRARLMSLHESPGTGPKSGVAGGVALDIVAFGFDHCAGKHSPIELASNQVPCATDGIAFKKRSLKDGGGTSSMAISKEPDNFDVSRHSRFRQR
jgi:hypothetical protein